MPCGAPTILLQRLEFRESPRGSRKYTNCYSYSLTGFYASDNNLRVTPRGSRKKPKAGRLPTCRLWTADANSHISCHAHVASMPRCAVALKSRFQNGMVAAWHGRGFVCVNPTRPHCVHEIGKTRYKTYAARHGRGTAWYCGLALTLSARRPFKL
jgi:hypothetical protein